MEILEEPSVSERQLLSAPGTPQLQPCKGEVESQYLLKDWEGARLRELLSSCVGRKFAPLGVFIGLNHLESYLG